MVLLKNFFKYFKGVFFGGNWLDFNYKDQLLDVDWQMVILKVVVFNIIV